MRLRAAARPPGQRTGRHACGQFTSIIWNPATLGGSASLWILVADKSQSRSNLSSFVGTDQCDRYGVRHSTVTLLDRRPASQLRATCASRLFIKPASPARSAFFQQLGVTPLLVVEVVVVGQVRTPPCTNVRQWRRLR